MNDSGRMRDFIDKVEEASILDMASSAVNKVKALAGDKQAKGSEEAKKLAKHMTGLYRTYLGHIGEEPTEENLMTFLVDKVGFTVENARKLFDTVGIKDPTMESSYTTGFMLLEDITKQQVDAVMMAAARFAYKYDLVPDAKPEKSNSQKSKSSSKRDDDDYGFRVKSQKPKQSGDRAPTNAEKTINDLHAKVKKEKDNPLSGVSLLNTIEPYATKFGVDTYAYDWLEDVIKDTKGDYAKLSQSANSAIVRDLYARLGFALMMYYVDNLKK